MFVSLNFLAHTDGLAMISAQPLNLRRRGSPVVVMSVVVLDREDLTTQSQCS